MKFPNFNMNKSFTARVLVLLAGLFLMAASISAQTTKDAPAASSAANLDQCRNGDGTAPCDATTSNQTGWFNGNVGSSNSSYSEDQYLPYRMTFTGLTVGTNYTLILGYDATHGGAHAIDYLGSYNTLTISNRATNTATLRPGVDPCSNVAGCAGAPTSTAPITQDNIAVVNETNPFTSGPIYQPSNQQFSIWGATGLTFAYESIDGNVLVDPQVERHVRITFTATVADPVLAWSGHVAYGGDWGAGLSAGGIHGSPYHMRLKGFCPTTTPPVGVDGCTTGGNQDRSLSADAVIISGIINVVKVVQTQGCAVGADCSANTAFPFTASAGFGPTTSFSLIDDNAGPGVDTQQSQAITAFGAANSVTVTEGSTFGWTLAGISCTSNVAASSTNTFPGGSSATITTNAGGVTTCTFTNSQLQITAAPASITGRLVDANGVGLRNVSVVLTDASTGTTRYALSNQFGYYVFDNCMTDDFYVMSTSSKRYTFTPSTHSFTLTDNLANMDFVANP